MVIIELIFNALVFLLLGVISLFPVLPALRFDSLDGVIQVLSLVDTFISLRVLSWCLLVILVLHNAHLLWSVIMWVVRKLPGLK